MPFWNPYDRMPAGAAGSVAGPQPGYQVYPYGMPQPALPGHLNALDASYHQQVVGGEYRPLPDVSPQFACEAEFLTRIFCACMIQGLLNIQQVGRAPSHIQVPYSGICFKRHIGTGTVASGDPPIALPPVGVGGAFTLLLDFEVTSGRNGVLKEWGVQVDPEPQRANLDFRIRVNGRVTPEFDSANGSAAPAPGNAGGSWIGMPYTILQPGDLCINLFAGDIVTLEGRNIAAAAPVNVAAFMAGWTYPPTIQTSDRTIRGTLTDQR